MAAVHAREDADFARIIAKQLAPDFQPSKFLFLFQKKTRNPEMDSKNNKQ